jgi:hypothetical protein
MPKLAVGVSIQLSASKPEPEPQPTPSVELQQWPIEELWLTAWPIYADGPPRLRLSSLAARIFRITSGYPPLRSKEATSGNEEGQGRRLVWRQQHDRADCSRADLAR